MEDMFKSIHDSRTMNIYAEITRQGSLRSHKSIDRNGLYLFWIYSGQGV